MRLTFRAIATAAVVVLGLLLVGPQQLGGPVAAVSTFGDSMLPTYEPHHLVAVRRDTEYDVGQVVAYHSETVDAVVLHRIVEGDADGWVTQGDNNDWIDPDRPTAKDVIGRAWFAIPGAGRLLEQPGPVRALLPLAAIGGIMLSTRRSQEDDRRHGWRRRSRHQGHTSSSRGTVLWAGRPTQVGATGAVLVIVGAVLAVAAWTRPVTEPGTVDYTHGGEFSYEADVPAGPVYPDGRIQTGDPVFLRLGDRLDVAFDWEFDSDPAPAELRGSGQLVAVVRDGSGWTTSLPLAQEVEWSGTQARLAGELDLGEVARVAARVAEATGVSSSSRTVTLMADIALEGTLDGAAFSAGAAPSMSLSVDELRAQPSSPADGEGAGGLFAASETGSVMVPGRETATLSVAGRSLPVAIVRPVSLALVALGMVLAAAAAFLAVRTRSWDEHRRIAARYGDTIVPITGLSSSRDQSHVAVPTIDQLVELASLRDLPVLRVPRKEGGYGYVVEDATVQYRYLIRSPQAGVQRSDVAPTARAPAPPRTAAPGTSAGDHRLFPPPPPTA